MVFDTTILAQTAVVVVGSIGGLTAIGIAAHAYISRTKRAALRVSASDDERLARLEQAIDAIAVEVERISEGQRFTTRVLTEKSAGHSE